MKGATLGRLLTSYLLLRQAMAAVGLTSVAGHPQTVRPLVAPMAEAAAEAKNDALTEGQRDVLRLAFLEGRSYPEIAEELDISEANVKTRVNRARLRLRSLARPGTEV